MVDVYIKPLLPAFFLNLIVLNIRTVLVMLFQ